MLPQLYPLAPAVQPCQHQKLMTSLEASKQLLITLSAIQQQLAALQQNPLPLLPNERRITAPYRLHGRKCQAGEGALHISFGGHWLTRAGFTSQYLRVMATNDLIVIVPDYARCEQEAGHEAYLNLLRSCKH